MKYFIFFLALFFNIFLFANENNSDTSKNKLPFDYYKYQLWFDSYSYGETDEKPYAEVDDFKATQLSKVYLKKWNNDTTCTSFLPLDTKSNQFQVYIAFCGGGIRRLITINNRNEVIDGMTAAMFPNDDGDWKQLSFHISENLEITLYKNKTDKKKVLSSKISGKYRIKEDGKFEKIE